MKEGGRGNSSRLVSVITRALVVGQIALTAAPVDRGDVANQIDPKSNEARLWLRRRCRLRCAYGPHGGRLPKRGFAAGVFQARRSRACEATLNSASAAMTDRFRMTLPEQAVNAEVDGQSYLTDRDRPRGNFESVSDDYFATLGLKISGRPRFYGR